MEMTKTAIHEAGHALAHIRLGILQDKITIVPNGETLGSVSAEDQACNKEQASDQIIALCAGYGALRVMGHDDEISRLGAGDDFEKADYLIGFWELGNLEEWLQRSVDFLAESKNREAIEMIATELQEHQTLGAGYTDVLVDYSDGEISDAEWEYFITVSLPGFNATPSTF